MATTDEAGAGAAPVPTGTGPIDGAGFAGKAHEHRVEHDMNGSASGAADGSAAPPTASEQGVDAPGGAQAGAVEGGASAGAAVGAAVQGEAADGSGSGADQGPAGVSSVSSSAAPTPPSPGSGSPGPAGTATAGSAGPGAGAGAVDAGGSDVAASGAGVADGGVDAVAARGGDGGDDVGAGPGHDGASGAGEGVAAPASAVGSALEPAAAQAAGGVVDDDDDDDDDGGGFFGSDDDDDDGDGDAFGAAGGGDAAGEEADVDMGVAPMGDGGRSAPAPAATVPTTPAVSAPAPAAVSAPLPSASAPGGGNVPAGTPPSAGTPGGVARTTAVGAAPSGAPAPAVVPPPPVPILRGTLSWREGDGKCVLSGQWAMSEKDPITSYFEYVSRLPAPASGQPLDGVYDGFFMMKLAATTEAKHEEKGLKLTFKPASVTDNQQAGDVLMRVEGAGKNVFNSFTLSGTYNPVTHEVVVHKAYAPKGRRGARGARGGRGRARGRGRKASTTPRKPRPAAMHRSLVGDNGAAVRTPASQQRRTSIATPRGAVPEITPRAQRKRALPAHLRQDAGPKMTEELQTCRKILKHLMQHEWAAPFLRAVDPVALNIPDYFDIIKQPMDLGTIETHMSKGTYTTHHEFANDVRLTFSNAVLYNKEGSDVHTMAKTLAAQFDQRFKEGMEAVAVRKRKVAAAERAEEAKRKSAKRRAMEERAATRTPRGSRSGRGGRGRTPRGSGGKGAKGSMRRGSSVISDDDDSGTDSRSTSRTPGKKRPAPARTPRAGGGAKSAKKPRRATPRAAAPAPGPSAGVSGSEVAFLRAQLAALQKQVVQLQQTSVPVFTMEDKRALSQNINQLPTDKLDTVVEIITARMPALANRPSDEDMEIDIDSLDNGTLTELQQFVSSCLAPKPKPRARAKKPSARKSKNQARRQAETTHQVDVLDEQLRSLDGFDAYGSAPIGGGLGLPGPTIADDDDDFGDAGYF